MSENESRKLTAQGEGHFVDFKSPGVRPLLDDWSRETNSPVFDALPKESNGMGRGPTGLSLTATKVRGDDVRPRFCWVGYGITDDWLPLMNESVPSKYTFKPTPFDPPNDTGTVGLEVEFLWQDEECRAFWEFPFHLMQKTGYVSVRLDEARDLSPIRYWRVPQS